MLLCLQSGDVYDKELAIHATKERFFVSTTSKWRALGTAFLDYLFVAFTVATALSPADTFPLTILAKMLMMCEALLSLTLAAILIARAVNIPRG